MDSVKEGFKLNLIELLEKSGKKKSDLAKACGVGKSAITNWTKGASSIDVEHIPAICDFFGITIGEFFSRAEELEPIQKLTIEESTLLDYFNRADYEGRQTILSVARAVSKEVG